MCVWALASHLNRQHFYLMEIYVDNALIAKISTGILIVLKVVLYNNALLGASSVLVPSVDGVNNGIHQKNLPVRRLQDMWTHSRVR